jgi:hypothetical protein
LPSVAKPNISPSALAIVIVISPLGDAPSAAFFFGTNLPLMNFVSFVSWLLFSAKKPFGEPLRC